MTAAQNLLCGTFYSTVIEVPESIPNSLFERTEMSPIMNGLISINLSKNGNFEPSLSLNSYFLRIEVLSGYALKENGVAPGVSFFLVFLFKSSWYVVKITSFTSPLCLLG